MGRYLETPISSTHLLIRATYNTLPRPQNLGKWLGPSMPAFITCFQAANSFNMRSIQVASWSSTEKAGKGPREKLTRGEYIKGASWRLRKHLPLSARRIGLKHQHHTTLQASSSSLGIEDVSGSVGQLHLQSEIQHHSHSRMWDCIEQEKAKCKKQRGKFLTQAKQTT